MGQALVIDEAGNTAGDRMLALIRTKYPEYHPILAIADLAHDKSNNDARVQLECHKTIIKYVTPELKSIEVKAEIKESRRVIVSMFQEGSIEEAQVVAERAVNKDLPRESIAVQEQLINLIAADEAVAV